MVEEASEVRGEEKSKLLVVDDSPTNRYVMRVMLEQAGYEVVECESGRACLDLCRSPDRPSMVLLDVMMPQMDGFEVCRRLREEFRYTELPVIMVTTLDKSKDVAQGLSVGANDYVTKPIDSVVLLARIETQRQLASMHRELEGHRQALINTLKIQEAMGSVLPDALVVHDSRGRVVYTNRQLSAQMSGPQASTIQEVIEAIFDGALRPEWRSFGRELSTNFEVRTQREINTGHPVARNVQIISCPVTVGERAEHRLWLFRDLTQTRELERRVNLQVKLDTVSRLGAGVAHNFNNIMGSILGATDLLGRRASGDPKVETCLGIIRKSVESGTKLSQKMFSLVREEEPGDENNSSDLSELLSMLVEVQQLLTRDRIRFELHAEPRLPRVLVHQRNLIDILANVVSNAVDAVPGEGEVLITAKCVQGADAIEVRICDSGLGMTDDTLEKIFEPFFTTKNLDSYNGVSMEGNGLGLWSVYHLLKLYGGSIDVTSELGHGTQVTIRVPSAPDSSYASKQD